MTEEGKAKRVYGKHQNSPSKKTHMFTNSKGKLISLSERKKHPVDFSANRRPNKDNIVILQSKKNTERQK
jgi:hypothetical protein